MADDLEVALRALGRELDVPPAPDVTAAVHARLRSAEPVRRRPVVRYALVILLLLVSGVIIAVPPVRAAVLEFFRIGGVELHQGTGPELPTGQPGPTQQPAVATQPVADLAQARRLTGVRVTVPVGLGPPNEILVLDGRVVSLVYRATGDRPAARLDAFGGRLHPMFAKFLRDDPVPVDVDGARGWYVSGPHTIIYVDEDGAERRASARLAASTLIWERDGITYRLEADLPADRLTAIARSMR